jgi:hypothetical protein
MLMITGWAMALKQRDFINEKNWLLVVIGGAIIAMALWMTVETLILFFKGTKAEAIYRRQEQV